MLQLTDEEMKYICQHTYILGQKHKDGIDWKYVRPEDSAILTAMILVATPQYLDGHINLKDVSDAKLRRTFSKEVHGFHFFFFFFGAFLIFFL